jgi:hypothetical protein
MKTLVASAMVFAAIASAQSPLKVEIPFDFRTVNATLPAGSYLVRRATTAVGNVTIFENASSHRSVVAQAAIMDPSRTDDPAIVFVCQNGSCALSAIRTANGTLTYARPRNARREEGALSFVSIPIVTRNGD